MKHILRRNPKNQDAQRGNKHDGGSRTDNHSHKEKGVLIGKRPTLPEKKAQVRTKIERNPRRRKALRRIQRGQKTEP